MATVLFSLFYSSHLVQRKRLEESTLNQQMMESSIKVLVQEKEVLAMVN